MTALRRDAILARLDAIRRAVERLRPHQDVPLAAFLGNDDEQWVVERGLHLAAEATLDVCNHLAAALRLPAPEDYTQAIDRLAEADVLPRDFAARFRRVGGFRNVLVHAYLEIDPRQVHAVLTRRLDDFLTFAQHIGTYLAG